MKTFSEVPEIKYFYTECPTSFQIVYGFKLRFSGQSENFKRNKHSKKFGCRKH